MLLSYALPHFIPGIALYRSGFSLQDYSGHLAIQVLDSFPRRAARDQEAFPSTRLEDRPLYVIVAFGASHLRAGWYRAYSGKEGR